MSFIQPIPCPSSGGPGECNSCVSQVLCDSSSTPGSEVVASTMQMLDTVNVAGNDGWNVTAYNTQNQPSVQMTNGCPALATPPLPLPYPAFYSADWCASYLAACPTADPGGSGCSLNPGAALGVTAEMEGVECVGGGSFDSYCARYTLEKTFTTDAACTRIRVTSQRFRGDGAAKVLIDGQDTGIFGQYNASSPDGTIIIPVTAGVHTMSIDLRDFASPTWVQGGLTIECLTITPATDTSVQFLRTTCRNCDGTIISTTDTTLDGVTPYTPVGTVGVCEAGPGSKPCTACETHVLFDKTIGLGGQVGCTAFLRKLCYNCDGTVLSVTNTLLDGTSPYTPTGDIGTDCAASSYDSRYLCDDNGTFVRTFYYDENGSLTNFKDTTYQTGAAYTTSGIITNCDGFDTEPIILCDDNGPFLRRFIYSAKSGLFVSAYDYLLDDSALYATVGTVKVCNPPTIPQLDVEEEVLQDNNGPFIRQYTYTDGVVTGTVDHTLTGAAYVPVGTVHHNIDVEEEILCDTNGPFIRQYTYSDGVFSSVTDITLSGAAYVPVGSVVRCPTTTSPVANALDSTIQRQTGAGTITITAGARSVTLVVLAGAPTVTINGDAPVAVPVGVTLTWSVDDRDESLLEPFTFTGGASDDFIITSTRL